MTSVGCITLSINNMFISKLSMIIHFPNLFLSTILLLLRLLPFSRAINLKYSACSTPYSCGQVHNISYPFWGNDRPDYCGRPEFELRCGAGAEYPTMTVYNNGSLGLDVHEINTSAQTMLISRNRLLQTCYMHDISKVSLISTLNPNPSRYIATITLFYGCNTRNCKLFTSSQNSFNCSNSDNNTMSPVYYLEHECDEISKNSSLLSLLSSCSCKNNISVPVDEKQLNELRSTNETRDLWKILTDSPVEVVYMFDFAKCSECKKSGGMCGSSSEDHEFVCHCKNGKDQQSMCIQQSDERRRLRILLILGPSVAGILMMMLIALLIYANKIRATDIFTYIWSKTSEDQNVATFLQSYRSLALKRYTYADIKKMTNSFKEKLGEGGYGAVYKGRLHDGRYVAVKNFKILKGDDGKDFINEVLSISRTNHVNIVTLLGFCFQGKNRALVFEFLQNGSLEKFIHDRESTGSSLDCQTMFNIAVGVAKGLDYLHRGCNTQILHFDIKPHNILLNEEFEPKISDFGLARLCSPKDSMISMSIARGTIGYIAPEVYSRRFGCISHKSDVYSYGMMLLDLVFGKKHVAFDAQGSKSETYFFPEWVFNRLEHMMVEEKMSDLKQELERKMVLVSLWCVQTYPSSRPPMNKVVEMLEGSFELLQMPPKPHLSIPIGIDFDSSPISNLSTT